MKIDNSYIKDTIGVTSDLTRGNPRYINRNVVFYPYGKVYSDWNQIENVFTGSYIINYRMWITTGASAVFNPNNTSQEWWGSFMGLVEYGDNFTFGYINFSSRKNYHFNKSDSTYSMNGRFVNSSTNKSYYINSKEILDLEDKLNKHRVCTKIENDIYDKKVEKNKLESKQ